MITVENMQAMFVGSFTHSLDAKRRIIFPSSWRNLLGASNRLFAFPHPDDKCLYLYTAEEMMRRLNQLRSGGPLDQLGQQAVRSFAAGADMLAVIDALFGRADIRAAAQAFADLFPTEEP